MGTHAKGPALLSQCGDWSGRLLSDWIKTNRWALGEGVASKFGDDQLPFLFKVLSINKALSIQAHPAKEHAQKLHQVAPEIYRDPNHKPEMAIAVSSFEGFCGFRLYEEIRDFVLGVAELRELVGEEAARGMNGGVVDRREALRGVFTELMGSEAEQVKEKLSQLLGRVQEGTAGEERGGGREWHSGGWEGGREWHSGGWEGGREWYSGSWEGGSGTVEIRREGVAQWRWSGTVKVGREGVAQWRLGGGSGTAEVGRREWHSGGWEGWSGTVEVGREGVAQWRLGGREWHSGGWEGGSGTVEVRGCQTAMSCVDVNTLTSHSYCN